MHWKQELIAAAGSLVFALSAFGQGGMSGAPGTAPDPGKTAETPTSGPTAGMAAHPVGSSTALVFLHQAHQNEIGMASLAKDRSSNKAVTDYAEMIINDHKKADDEVQSLARAHNIDLKQAAPGSQAAREEGKEAIDDALRSREGDPARPMTHEKVAGIHTRAMEELSKLKGPEFDRQFAKTMVIDHHSVIERLRSVRSSESNRDVAQLIDKLLPTLQKHESAAQQLESRVSRAS